MNITDFFNNQVRDANLYTNYRVLPGIDGLKNTQRKCLYVMQNNGDKESKISNKASEIAIATEYLHGNTSLESVLSGLNVSYEGSGNNLPLLEGIGQFGSKFNPEAIGASRYVYTKKSKIFDLYFKKDDIDIYDKVFFEGTQIESIMMPTLIPLGMFQYSIGSGFASLIMPRKITNVIKYLKNSISNIPMTPSEVNKLLLPHINGFSGLVSMNENTASFVGKYQKINTYTINITEIKPFMGLEAYLFHLDKLIKDKVIKSYIDDSSSNNFNFTITVPGNFWDEYNTTEKVVKILNLSENMNENITMFNENNQLVIYNNIEEYCKYFINWRLSKYNDRKDSIIKKLEAKLSLATSRAFFIKSVLDKTIVIERMSKADVIKQIDTIEQIKKVDDSYDVYISMPLYSLTLEKIEELKKEVAKIKAELETVKNTSINDMWLNDISAIEKVLK
jgi:DNA topoisomerase-2